MAIRTRDNSGTKIKMILLTISLVGFLFWRFSSGGFDLSFLGSASDSVVSDTSGGSTLSDKFLISDVVEPIRHFSDERTYFVDVLMKDYKPRLTAYTYNVDQGSNGYIDFYLESEVVERLYLSQLRAFGVAFVHKKYGVDMITGTSTYVITSWPLSILSPLEPSLPVLEDPVDQDLEVSDS
jgi:hypothetical protein